MCGLFYYLEHNIMPVPTSIADLSKNAADNSPKGTESAKGTIDDYFRAHAGFIRLLADLVGGPTVALPSAATVNIGFAGSLSIAITGTADIFAFDNIDEGAMRWVTFAGAMRLTHSANLQLPGAANIQTSSGDVAVFKSLGGGNWKCMAYQRVSGAGVVPALPLAGGTMAGSIIFANDKGVLGLDTNGGLHQIFKLGVDNNINFVNGPGGRWRLYNSEGASVIFEVDNSGAISTAGGLTVNNNVAIASKDAGGTVRPLLYMAGNTVVHRVAGGGSVSWYDQAGSTLVASLSNVGDFVARTGTFNSDERLKKNWRRTPADLLQRVARLRKLGNFLWKKDGVPGIGASAQEFEEVWPEAVHTDAKGIKSFNYGPAAFVIAVELVRAFFAYVVKTDKRLAKLEGK